MTNPNIATAARSAIFLANNEDFILFFDTENLLHLTGAKNVAGVLTFVDYEGAAVGGMTYKGTIDASTNPNFPAAIVGDTYVVSVSGTICGVPVLVGDIVISKAVQASGCILANWDVVASGNPSPTASIFGHFYQRVTDVAGTIAANNGKALFQIANILNTSGFAMVAGSGDITVTNPGTYKVNFDVSGAEASAFQVFKNGVGVTGSIYGSGAGTQQNDGFTLVDIEGGDVISLRTNNCPAAITLQLAGTTDVNQIVASIFLQKIS